MLRRTFITVSGPSLLLGPLRSQAQNPAPTRRLGILATGLGSDAANKRLLDATVFRKLQELGWTVGGNLLVDYLSAEGHYERLPGLAEQLLQRKVDVIFTVGSPLNLDAARKVTSTVPIVMAGGFIDIIGTGIVQSLARPGGNVTGMAATSDAIPGKRLQLLQQSFPAMVRVGFLFEPGASSQAANDDLLAKAAQSLKLELSRYEVRASTEFEAALQRARMANVDALYVGGSTLLSSQHARGLAELLIKYKFASMAYWNNMADSGFLMGYSASIFDLYNRSALYIDKIFRGANPAVLSIKEPSRYEFAVNLKTAKLIGVTISQDVLLRADRVID